MRLLVALLGPAVLAVALMEAASHVVADESADGPRTAPLGLAWAGRVFWSEREFARWLEVRGHSYEEWSRRHPGSPWAQTAGTGTSVRRDTPSEEPSRLALLAPVALGSAFAVFAVLAFARRRPRYASEGLYEPAFDVAIGGPTRDRRPRVALEVAANEFVLGLGRGVHLFLLSVVRGALVVWATVTVVIPRAWRVVRHGADEVRVATPEAARAARRGVVRAADAADELYDHVHRASEFRTLRVALGYGVVTIASGVVGIAIAIAMH